MLKRNKGLSMTTRFRRSVLSTVVSTALPRNLLAAFSVLALASGNALAEVEQFSLKGNTLHVDTDTNDFTITALGNKSFQVIYLTDDGGKSYLNLPAMALPAETAINNLDVSVSETPDAITLAYNKVAASIDKQSHAISYSLNGEMVAKERDGLSVSDNKVSLSFALDEDEKLYGGGQRGVGYGSSW